MKLSKLMWSFVISATATLPVSTQASSWLNCEVLAKVEDIRNQSITNGTSLQEVRIHLLSNPYSCEGHSIPKKLSKGQSLWVGIVSVDETAKIKVGTEIKFKREVYNGMGPDGLIESDEWSILEIMK